MMWEVLFSGCTSRMDFWVSLIRLIVTKSRILLSLSTVIFHTLDSITFYNTLYPIVYE